MSAIAAANPSNFYIGIDANAKPLEKLSTKITRKPAKGGLANAMFVRAAAEHPPREFDGIASEIYVNFPWGSLLQAVAVGEESILKSFRRMMTPEGNLQVTIGMDPERDRSEFQRLGLPRFDEQYLLTTLLPRYASAGFSCEDLRKLQSSEWSKIETSWARKLGGNENRHVYRLRFVRN